MASADESGKESIRAWERTASEPQESLMLFRPRYDTLIHPRTIDVANEAFSPSPEEIEWSRKIIVAHGEAMKQGKGVAVYEGHLIENLHVENALRIVDMAESIAARGNGQDRVGAA